MGMDSPGCSDSRADRRGRQSQPRTHMAPQRVASRTIWQGSARNLPSVRSMLSRAGARIASPHLAECGSRREKRVMAMHRLNLVLLALSGVIARPAAATTAEESIDLEMVTKLRDEGLRRSQVMTIARQLTDMIGPRLTGSPGLKQANAWTRDQLKE